MPKLADVTQPFTADGTYTYPVTRPGWYSVHVIPSNGNVTVAQNGLAFDGFNAATAENRDVVFLAQGSLAVTTAGTWTGSVLISGPESN